LRTLVEILQKDLRAVTNMQIRIAQNERRRTGEKLEEALCRLGFIKEETIAEALGLQYQLATITTIDPREIDLIWLNQHGSLVRAKRSKFLPLRSRASARTSVTAFSICHITRRQRINQPVHYTLPC